MKYEIFGSSPQGLYESRKFLPCRTVTPRVIISQKRREHRPRRSSQDTTTAGENAVKAACGAHDVFVAT
jgi:hypothetical protein